MEYFTFSIGFSEILRTRFAMENADFWRFYSMAISKRKRFNRLGALLGKRIQGIPTRARKTKANTDERMMTFRRRPIPPNSTVRRSTIGSLDADGRGGTMIANDFIDYLFPFIDHNYGSKKVSMLLVIFLRLSPYNKTKQSYESIEVSLTELAQFSAQTIKTVQHSVQILFDLGLISVHRHSGRNHMYTLKRASLIRQTKASMKYQGLEIIE